MAVEIQSRGWKSYHYVWVSLLFGWIVGAADRTVTGPVVTWMIQHKVSFLLHAVHPYALGGLVGSVFFAAYMLTQFPGGYLGDKFGHRKIIAISLIWAGVATVVSGIFATLLGFVALRVITGLGEGLYYANDRSLIMEVTPFEKRSLGMGVVITGLAVGITLALILPPFLIQWGNSVLGTGQGWRMPFLVLGTATLIVGVVVSRYLNKGQPKKSSYGVALRGVGKYTVVFFIAILAVFIIADRMGIPSWGGKSVV